MATQQNAKTAAEKDAIRTEARELSVLSAENVCFYLGLTYQAREMHEDAIGFFRKDFGASLLRSTFHLEGPGYAGTGQERSQAVALIRRFTDIPFLPIHFDFVDAQGSPLFSVERKMSIGDRYRVPGRGSGPGSPSDPDQ